MNKELNAKANVPQYIIEMMSRATFARGYGDPGYTLEISKATPYTRIRTLKDEVTRLEKWIVRQMPEDELDVPTCIVNRVPSKTHYCKQNAVVTIYDPIMKKLEPYIGK